MGASTSSHSRRSESYAIPQIVQEQWNSFKENCCIEDPNSYISVKDLEALFASYMSKGRRGHTVSLITIASDHIVNLVADDGFKLSCGWAIRNQRVDTRLVLGLKVVNLDGFV